MATMLALTACTAAAHQVRQHSHQEQWETSVYMAPAEIPEQMGAPAKCLKVHCTLRAALELLQQEATAQLC